VKLFIHFPSPTVV